MRLKRRIIHTFIVLGAAAAAVPPPALTGDSGSAGTKPLRIKWQAVDEAIRYRVQIVDAGGATALDTVVETNEVEFTLPPGSYRIRIGVINKFEKIGFWSDWDTFEIRKGERSAFFSTRFPAKGGFMLRGGLSYHFVLPPWNSVYRGSSFTLSHLGIHGSIGLHFGDARYIKSEGFLRYTGIELEGSLCRYRDHNNPFFQTKLTNATAGPALFIKTRFKVPVNIICRFGAGASYTRQTYRRFNILGMPIRYGTIRSFDPYARAGAALDFSFLYAVNCSIGADYFVTFYSNKFFSTLRFTAMAGVRL